MVTTMIRSIKKDDEKRKLKRSSSHKSVHLRTQKTVFKSLLKPIQEKLDRVKSQNADLVSENKGIHELAKSLFKSQQQSLSENAELKAQMGEMAKAITMLAEGQKALKSDAKKSDKAYAEAIEKSQNATLEAVHEDSRKLSKNLAASIDHRMEEIAKEAPKEALAEIKNTGKGFVTLSRKIDVQLSKIAEGTDAFDKALVDAKEERDETVRVMADVSLEFEEKMNEASRVAELFTDSASMIAKEYADTTKDFDDIATKISKDSESNLGKIKRVVESIAREFGKSVQGDMNGVFDEVERRLTELAAQNTEMTSSVAVGVEDFRELAIEMTNETREKLTETTDDMTDHLLDVKKQVGSVITKMTSNSRRLDETAIQMHEVAEVIDLATGSMVKALSVGTEQAVEKKTKTLKERQDESGDE